MTRLTSGDGNTLGCIEVISAAQYEFVKSVQLWALKNGTCMVLDSRHFWPIIIGEIV